MTNQYIILFFIIFIFPYSAWAQQDNVPTDVLPPVIMDAMPESEILPDVLLLKRTHPENIIFSQIKLSGGKPNIDKFAKASPFVEQAQEIDKSAMILAEYNRIGNKYNLHNQNEEIIVHTKVKADEYSSLQNLIVFDEFDETTFFQFGMYGYNVGIVPDNIAGFSKLRLSKPRAEKMFQNVSVGGKLLAEFVLKPVYADKKEPFVMNNSEYWLMFARIAEFRLWSNDKSDGAELLWYHRAPWYSPDDKSDIGNLFVTQ